jgi:hypothetical protein
MAIAIKDYQRKFQFNFLFTRDSLIVTPMYVQYVRYRHRDYTPPLSPSLPWEGDRGGCYCTLDQIYSERIESKVHDAVIVAVVLLDHGVTHHGELLLNGAPRGLVVGQRQ